MKKPKLTAYQKRTIIEDVYNGFIAAALDQQKTLGQIIVTDPGSEEARFAFNVADRLLGFLQTKNAGEFKKVPADPVKIQVRTNNGKRYIISQQAGSGEIPEADPDGEVGGDNEPAVASALPDGT